MPACFWRRFMCHRAAEPARLGALSYGLIGLVLIHHTQRFRWIASMIVGPAAFVNRVVEARLCGARFL